LTLTGRRICIAIPDTILEEHDSIREKTTKLGQIARYCSIFGVDLVRIFHDPRGRGESRFMKLVLDYLETPQYLRRRLFPLSEDLRFAGLLPPLRIPSHKVKVPPGRLKDGEFREGVVLADGFTVDAGLDIPIVLRRKETPQNRLTIKITSASTSKVEGIPVDRREIPVYWGYQVEVAAGSALSGTDFPLRIATSRHGDPVTRVAKELRVDLRNTAGAMLLFGPPSRGLFDILGNDLREKVDYVVNLFPAQNVVTARSEEAIFSALYLVGLLGSPELPPFA
jgi:methyltransferase